MSVHLTKATLQTLISEQIGMTPHESKKLVDTFLEELVKGLCADKKMCLSGFGTFEVLKKKSRPARNPKTGEEVTIPPQEVAVFYPSQKLVDLVNLS